jgi:uncharacterized protein (TIGR02145 family)
LSGENVAGGKMKETGTTHWTIPNTGATNYSGFSGLPSGLRDELGWFSCIRECVYYWSSSENSTSTAWNVGLFYQNEEAFMNPSGYNKNFGFSIRCLKD